MGISVKLTARGLPQVRKFFKEGPKQATIRMAADLKDLGEHFLLDRIRLNTPIKTGALRSSLTVKEPVVKGDTVAIQINSVKDYALRIHEEQFTLGARSAAQPPQPEGGVGNKYITRVLRYHARTIRLLLGASITRTLRKLYPSGALRQLK